MINDAMVFKTARVLVILILVSMTRAFALVSLLELVLICLVIFNGQLRRKCLLAISHPAVKLIFIFWGWTLISGVWSEASLGESFKEFWSWRKLLLVPIIKATFGDEQWKIRFLLIIVVISALYMVISWLGFLGVLELDRSPAQLLENHTTQGIFFTFSTFILALFIREGLVKNVWFKSLILVLAVGFIANLFIILTGRSGYLFFLVGCAVFIFTSVKHYRVALAVVLLSSIVAGFSLSETPKARIIQALHEVETVDSSDAGYSSLGIRVVMWRTTLQMIENKPLLGAGSGGFQIDYGKIVANEIGWRSQIADDPHQQFMHIAAEHGLVGLGIFVVALMIIAHTLRFSPPLYRDAGYIMLLGIGATSLANGHFNTFVEGRLVWMVIAVCIPMLNNKIIDLKSTA